MTLRRDTRTPTDETPTDDTAEGQAMFLIFVAAVLIVTGVVAVLAVIDSWWMLAAAVGIQGVVTLVVFLTIWRLVSKRSATRRPRPRAGAEQKPRGDARRPYREPVKALRT